MIFLAAYLRSKLARYFLFHTSSNWGVSRAKVHVEELLRIPFPLPEQSHDPKRCRAIVREAEENPGALREAPVRCKVKRLDETAAARNPCLTG